MVDSALLFRRKTGTGDLPLRTFAAIIFLLLSAASARAQQPFNTDDADVTDYKHWHLESANEYDVLQKSSYPNLRQNTFNVKVAYGIRPHVEIGFDNQLIAIFNAPSNGITTSVFGYGDLDLSVKVNFHKEKEGHFLPALTASFSLEVPTGDARKQLGSGLADYYLNLVAQKSLTAKTKLRLNSGMLFAGNTLTGALGLNSRGTVFTGAASVVRQFTDRLDLGAEIFGATTSNFDLGRGQLQTQVGGNYALKKNLSLDFGVTGGTFPGSPRMGAQMGFSVNF